MSANTLGKYQIVREIARSNDIVYEAVDTSINRRVALKELLVPQNLTGVQRRERVERFYREARAAGTLTHPNIVTIYEAGEDNGRHFIAMEYLEGQTLRDILQIEGKIALDKAVDIAKQVCAGLEYAHSRNIIHRDIKPDNVQILPSGLVKITDFGIARIMEEPTLTADGQIFGTPSYMSPEQVAGKPLDQRSDLFSLGVMFFEMLTGSKPFSGDSVVTITYNIVNQQVTLPTYLPPYIERVVNRSLSKDPSMRYSSAAEMVADLSDTSYQPYSPRPQPDPFGRTMQASGPMFDPQTQYPQPPPQPYPDLPPPPFQQLAARPRKQVSAETRFFFKTMFTVIAICAVIVGFIWVLNAGYQGYMRQAGMSQVQTHFDAAKKHYDQQSYQAAIDEYKKALSMSRDPEMIKTAKQNIAVAYINLGMQQDSAGNVSGAMVCYQQALIYDPGSGVGYLYLGNSFFRQSREEEALNAWTKALQIGGSTNVGNQARQNCAVLYNRRGDDAYSKGDPPGAADWWRKAVDIAPGTQAGFTAQDKLDKVGG